MKSLLNGIYGSSTTRSGEEGYKLQETQSSAGLVGYEFLPNGIKSGKQTGIRGSDREATNGETSPKPVMSLQQRLEALKTRPFRVATLLKRRQTLFLLVQHKSKKPPILNRLYAVTTGAVKKYARDPGVDTTATPKLFVGKSELLMLLEFD